MWYQHKVIDDHLYLVRIRRDSQLCRGPYISAMGHCFCVNHFICSNCSMNLIDCGFVEENGKLYCEHDFEQFLAPHCTKCSQAVLKVRTRECSSVTCLITIQLDERLSTCFCNLC
jgi:hypothetical protein